VPGETELARQAGRERPLSAWNVKRSNEPGTSAKESARIPLQDIEEKRENAASIQEKGLGGETVNNRCSPSAVKVVPKRVHYSAKGSRRPNARWSILSAITTSRGQSFQRPENCLTIY